MAGFSFEGDKAVRCVATEPPPQAQRDPHRPAAVDECVASEVTRLTPLPQMCQFAFENLAILALSRR